MASAWDHFGDIANVAQLTGLDAVKLIGMIAQAANTARMHKKNCKQFAMHLKLIGNLLQQLKISELKRYPETREPLEQLEDALRRSYILVNSCQDRSYFYLLAMGWNIVYQFRRAQNEIDNYLKLIPLITLVDNARVRERLEYIGRDQHEYVLDDEDRKVQDVIMKPEPSHADTVILKKTLSCRYPNLPFKEVIQKENEKLHLELQRSQAHLDVSQCQVIQHLIEVTEAVASKSQHEQDSPKKVTKKSETHYLDVNTDREIVLYEGNSNKKTHSTSRSTSSASYGQDLASARGSYGHGEWHSDLLGCCSEPKMCLKTFFFPCGTFSKIASVATNKHMTSAEACNELMAYSLILSCCCYTCCVRRKLRKTLNITGGWCDDFLSHVMCCCCALVQELREVEMRGIHGPEKTKTSPPPSQWMES
ncbi:putative PLAC8 motif-containing protein [Helianthus annuus]|uniref:PLAC8 motif-containing protein n=1 Tax=Helianthus annuus TaxID=4232 RepID=A0A251SFW8_HELAN|nr:protein MID1-COMPLEMENTING ACTIVITY 1 [Helianthus annuus]XP_022013180.1 protein MID1-COMPLEMENTING ACTIVITY 1 [Helianthus annuus]KAF5765177.1 putative PLAC8 motif-containing protein [Helianthus annuus]KAJ0451741.1 putative PLAC8 motif-containing protein [Helianthus annuus]KAJ0473627.1 putative PLAC8 motif-containing protein [Helianthus annuus]KAJ0649204.1 putative PLAC8 motif-containing protein [Helianthus annuus]KAJ0653005.1 putative PLAC8 motif-containing protein [Helianthus annuus]